MIKDYVAFDLETTGLNVETDYIIEIGALKVRDGKVCERFMEFVKPQVPISPMITNITGITNEMVTGARNTRDIIRDFVEFCGDFVLVGHNIMFDYKFTKKYASEYGFAFEKSGIDTLKIARKALCNLDSKSLGTLCKHYGIINQAAHRAYHDALATAKIYHHLAHDFENKESKLFMPEALQLKPKKVQPCTLRQVEYLRSLCTYHNISIQDNPENLTRSEMSRLIDTIITTHGKMYTE
ncbi:MAG: 3'-5' exonuclease [Tyzzerella sp.]|nr:3'-5' exonuclease [Tyzzerella sp.]